MNLKIIVPSALCEIIDRLEEAGFSAYFVGGCVRDCILGITPSDYDIASSATPEQVIELFSDCKVIPTGIKHGTVTVIYKNRHTEITTFRTDGVYTDFRRPDSVVFSDSIEEDSKRRDFTINALCYNPKRGVLDFNGGIEDLNNGVIRCVGDPYRRFKEDALRILRALRFAGRFGFSIEAQTANAMLFSKELLSNIAAERILAELNGFFASDGSVALLKEFFGVIATAIGFNGKLDLLLMEKLLKATTPSFRLPAFFALCGGNVEDATALIKSLRADGVTADAVLAAAVAIYEPCFSDVYSVACTVRRYGSECAESMYILAENYGNDICDNASLRIRLMKNGSLPLTIKDLAISATELMEQGIASGKDIGTMLEHLYYSVHNGLENTKSALLAEANKYFEL